MTKREELITRINKIIKSGVTFNECNKRALIIELMIDNISSQNLKVYHDGHAAEDVYTVIIPNKRRQRD